jgi:aminoglycoside phosphotransferase (APT) family kinase protein
MSGVAEPSANEQRLGRGRRAEVLARGGDVLKLYFEEGKAEAFREAAILSLVEEAGLPAPVVRTAGSFDGRWGVVMSRAPGETFAAQVERNPALLPDMLATVAALQAKIHACSGVGLPSLAARLHRNLDRAAVLDDRLRQRLHDALAAQPGADRLCHGDFHPINVVGPFAAPIVIDWPDATCGPPAADACRTLLLFELAMPTLAPAYFEAYLRVTGTPRDEVLGWMPILAGARLAEDVPGEADRLLTLAATT